MLKMWAFILFHHCPQHRCLIKSPCDLLILRAAEGNDSSNSSSSVKPFRGAPPTPSFTNELRREHPNLLTKLWKRPDQFAGRWMPRLHPNQAPTDMSNISFLTMSLKMHQIRNHRASLTAGQLLLPSYFIFLSNITALWWSAASVSIS